MNRLRTVSALVFFFTAVMLEEPAIDPAWDDYREEEAPQPPRETRKVTAYYMGITLYRNVRIHAFIKIFKQGSSRFR